MKPKTRPYQCICEYCDGVFNGVRPGQRYCTPKHAYFAKQQRNEGTHTKVPPMPRDQAVVNSFLMGRSHQSVDDLISQVFEREVG